MAVKKTLVCFHCGSRTLHQEISYTDAVEYSREKNVFLKGYALFLDHYPLAKPLTRAIGGAEVIMQCSVCGYLCGLESNKW